MARVDVDPVRLHSICNLVDNALFGCLYSQTLLYLCDVVGTRSLHVNSRQTQHLLQPQPLSIYYMLIIFLGNECPGDGMYTSNNNPTQFSPQRFQLKHQIGFGYRYDIDGFDIDYL